MKDTKDMTQEEALQSLVDDYTTQKQQSLMQMKKGLLSKEEFLQEARAHIQTYYHMPGAKEEKLLTAFEQYIFGYSRLSPLIDDKAVSDIRVVSFDNIRVKR